MLAYDWPGNIRELEHLLERAAILATTPIISMAEPLEGHPTLPVVTLSPYKAAPPASEVSPALPGLELPLVKPYDQAERENVLAALQLANFRIRGKEGAAALLNIKPTTLEARMARLGIRRQHYAY
jgi:transcriptional regulator with GAF, ATPase, and Fis domain